MTQATRRAPRFSRRHLMRLAALGALAACSPAASRSEPVATTPPATVEARRSARPTASPARPSTTAPPPTVSPTTTPSPAAATPTPPAPYVPVDGDVVPEAKELAGRVAQRLTTYSADESMDQIIATVREEADDGLDVAALAAEAASLHHPGSASSGMIEYAQLGGLAPNEWNPTQASVMVVVRQRLSGRDGQQSSRRTLDVRLRAEDGAWRFDGLASAGGTEVPRPARLPAVAAAVLDHPHIDLTDSARWDIHAGIIADPLLEAMALLAEEAQYAVTCLRSGHPVNVFGTHHTSNHTLGRAVDIWSVGAVPVVLQHDDEDSPARHMTAAAFAMTDVTELGSPWDLDGPPPPPTRSFTNLVHHDHLHIALEGPRDTPSEPRP